MKKIKEGMKGRTRVQEEKREKKKASRKNNLKRKLWETKNDRKFGNKIIKLVSNEMEEEMRHIP